MLKGILQKYCILFAISVLLYFIHAAVTLQGVYGDGNGYYSYTNTLFFQGNLDFGPVYEHLGNFTGTKYTFSRVFWDRNENPFLIGTAIIWLPSMAFIRFMSNLFNLDIGRFDLLYELGPGITGIVLMIGGLYFLEKYLLNFFNKKTVFWTILTLFFGSNVFYYTTLEPALSHQPVFFIISFLLWWTYKFKKTAFRIFLLGLIAGVLGTIRIADTVLLIPVIFQARLRIKDCLFFLAGGLIAAIPQVANQYYMYGTIFTHPYLTGGGGTWEFSFKHLFEQLYSPMRGLFTWTPVFLISLYGLIKSKSLIFMTPVVLLWLITSSWSAYLSAGFGQRFYFGAIPFFSYGLAYVYSKTDLKRIILIGAMFTVWNMLLIKNVYLHKDLFIQSSGFTFNQFFTYMLQLK
jgi:hypothetical protein